MLGELLFSGIKLADISILDGKVSNLKYMIHRNFENSGFVTTFEIRSQSIVLTSDSPILIDLGDHISVAGYVRQGIFKSTAYYNLSKKVYNTNYNERYFFYFFAFLLSGIAVFSSSFLYNSFSPMAIVVLFVFLGYRFYYAGKIISQTCSLILKKNY